MRKINPSGLGVLIRGGIYEQCLVAVGVDRASDVELDFRFLATRNVVICGVELAMVEVLAISRRFWRVDIPGQTISIFISWRSWFNSTYLRYILTVNCFFIMRNITYSTKNKLVHGYIL